MSQAQDGMQINLSMRDIDTTLVLGRTLNFRQAAAQLHLSQSALSTQIQRIEEALGVRLFDRTTRTVRLTAAGEVFMQQAAALQVAFRDAIAAVSGIASAEHGQVSVAALPSLAARLLPRVLMAYRQAHPQVALKVRDTLSGPAFDLVRAGDVDFALTAADPQHADLHYQPLMSDSFLLLIPEAHPLARSGAAALGRHGRRGARVDGASEQRAPVHRMGLPAESHPLHAGLRGRTPDHHRGDGGVRFRGGGITGNRGRRGGAERHRAAAADRPGGRTLDRAGDGAQPQPAAGGRGAGGDAAAVSG